MDIEQELQFTSEWKFDPTTTPRPVNQVLFHVGLPTNAGTISEFYISLGHANPPVILPMPDGSPFTIPADGKLPVEVAGHFSFTYDRLVEFRNLLNAWVDSLPSATPAANAE